MNIYFTWVEKNLIKMTILFIGNIDFWRYRKRCFEINDSRIKATNDSFKLCVLYKMQIFIYLH